MKRKWKIFKDYYLKLTILIIIAVVGLVYFCYNKKENALQVIMMDVRCHMEQQEEFEKRTGEVIGIDSQKEFVELAFCHSEEMLVTVMVNNKVDMFLMSEDYFEIMLSQECLYPLDELVAEEIGQDELQSDSAAFRGEDGKIYGYSVKNNPWIEQFGFESTDDIILGIVGNGPNGQNADVFVRFLLGE